jgi:hypothetical protein
MTMEVPIASVVKIKGSCSINHGLDLGIVLRLGSLSCRLAVHISIGFLAASLDQLLDSACVKFGVVEVQTRSDSS